MINTVMDRPDLVKIKDLRIFGTCEQTVTIQTSERYASEKIESLVAADLDEFYEEKKYWAYWYGQESEEMEFQNSLAWI